MDNLEIGFDLSDLANVEHACRTTLALEPAAYAVRLELVGCLLARAMFQAGQESMLERLMYSPEVPTSNLVAAVEHSLAQDANQLLHESRRHAMLIHELAADPATASIAIKFGSILERCFAKTVKLASTDSPDLPGGAPSWLNSSHDFLV